MARDLSTTIQSTFSGYSYTRRHYNSFNRAFSNLRRMMEIPIKGDTVEIPTFALEKFKELVAREDDRTTDAFVVSLYSAITYDRYKTVDRFMRDVLQEDLSSHLLELKVGTDDNPIFYYGTHGAVFDKDFNPIMMLSWILKREDMLDEEGKTVSRHYIDAQPVLRISPEVYLRKADTMQRWIVNKVTNTCLEYSITNPFNDLFLTGFINYSGSPLTRTVDVKVEICESPFKPKDADTPSVSTSNKDLLQLAIDHIDEVMQ